MELKREKMSNMWGGMGGEQDHALCPPPPCMWSSSSVVVFRCSFLSQY